MKMSDYGPFVPLNKEQSEILTSILQCYRLVVPLFISILGTIVTNLLLYAIDWQTVLSRISILK